MYFDVNLGNRYMQRFQFVYYFVVKVQYVCLFGLEVCVLGFLLECFIVDVGFVDLDGFIVEVVVIYEFWVVVNVVQVFMIVFYVVGGCYCVQFFGSCYDFVLQGLIICLGGKGYVSFCNVFNDVVSYVYVLDNFVFLVVKGEKMVLKKSGKIWVVYKLVFGFFFNGKFVVICFDYGFWIWVFYL